jgi:hypothetical protein
MAADTATEAAAANQRPLPSANAFPPTNSSLTPYVAGVAMFPGLFLKPW